MFSYDANGQLVEKITQLFDVNWQNVSQEVYSYLNGNLSQVALFSWVNQSWKSDGQLMHEYDILNNKISTVYQIPDTVQGGWLNNWQQNWLYNSFNQPVLYASTTWSVAQNQWTVAEGDFIHRYYYQTYNPNSVQNPDLTAASWSIFPIPAQEGFYVASKVEQTTNFQFELFDVLGKNVMKPISNDFKDKLYIDVRNLPSGQYWLVAENGKTKQIEPVVVAH